MVERSIEDIVDDFAFLDDWEDRYRYVIELGRAMPPFPEDQRTDAMIVKGLIAILVAQFSGRPAEDIVRTDPTDTFASIGLTEHLTQQRANGLASMVQRIKAEAQHALAESAG